MKLVVCSLLLILLAMFGFFSFRRKDAWKTKVTPYVPVEGIVTGKQWIPEHDEMDVTTTVDYQGMPTIITPYWTHYTEAWIIFVGRRSCRVSKEEFKLIEIGVFWKEKLENDNHGR